MSTLLIAGIAALGGGVYLMSSLKKFWKYQWKKRLYRACMLADYNGSPLVYTDERVCPKELSPGDHIFTPIPDDAPGTFATTVRGAIFGAGYSSAYKVGLPLYHHGVYLGQVKEKSDQVAEFGRHSEEFPAIRPLEEFMYGDMERVLFIRRVKRGFTFPLEEIERMAKDMDGNREWGEYDWVDNNCEHFAEFLKTGRVWSKQSYVYY